MDCLFCKIGKKEIPAEIVYEDEDVFAILDIYPVAPGHTMVIPKIHAQNLLDLDDSKVAPVFLGVKKVLGILKKTIKPDGFTVGINHGTVSGQVVDHLHIHLIPRFLNDHGKSVHSVVLNPPTETPEEIGKRIRDFKSPA